MVTLLGLPVVTIASASHWLSSIFTVRDASDPGTDPRRIGRSCEPVSCSHILASWTCVQWFFSSVSAQLFSASWQGHPLVSWDFVLGPFLLAFYPSSQEGPSVLSLLLTLQLEPSQEFRLVCSGAHLCPLASSPSSH